LRRADVNRARIARAEMRLNDGINTRRLFASMDACLQKDERPSLFIERVSSSPNFARHPFDMLLRLKDTEQSKRYHPEGSVWNHTLLVVDEAAKRRDQADDARAFMWAALLHDIGKPDTTRRRNEKITAYDHDRVGADLSVRFLRAFDCGEEFIGRVRALVRYHMHLLYVLRDLPFADIASLRRDVSPQDLALLCLCDRLGRLGADPGEEAADIARFLARITESERR
jgi:putative nucleotidyltransferase with HDIG domain